MLMVMTGTATRTVNVVDTTAPVITLEGTNPMTVELGGTYSEPGADIKWRRNSNNYRFSRY